MGSQFLTRGIFFLIILNVCLYQLRGQENSIVDLEYLYNDWAFSYNESYGDIFILRRSRDEDFLSMEERKDWYDFKNGHDSVLHNERIFFKRRIVCGVGYSGKITEENELGGLCNLWTYDSTKLTLSHTLYSYLSDEQQFPIFTSIYKILEIKENYMRLHLEKELFEGVEIE